MRPKILITSSAIIRSGDEWAPVVYGQSHTYLDAVIKAGGTPFIVPITDNLDVLKQLYELSDGLLFSGGGDIEPTLYNEEPAGRLENITPIRDMQEVQLLKWALMDDKPLLGICRGMQIINVGLGGSLHQDIQTNIPKAVNHESSVVEQDFNHMAHDLILNPNTKLKKILGVEEIKTNALHHQAINRLGHGIIVAAHAEDGIIEAIEIPDKKFVIGVQSHPESLESETEPIWSELFKAFINSSR